MDETIAISTPSLGDEEWEALREPLSTGWLTQGPKVAAFERAFANRHRVEHALATTSCTTALHLMLVAAGIGPGDEVIVPSFTWVSTANAVVYTGATPVLADVDPDTYNIDAADVATKVTARTKAVIVVHLFGLCVDIRQLRRLLPSHVLVFEDAACAAGAELHGDPAGSMGHAAAFSFHPRKSITTGEGGMLTTGDPDLAQRAAKMRNHGAGVSEEERHAGPQPYLLPEFDHLGFNYRMTDLQGAVGLVQLGKLDRFIEGRDVIARMYERELGCLEEVQLPQRPVDGRHAWQAFVVRVLGSDGHSRRNKMMAELMDLGISTRPGTHSVHSLGYYQRMLGYSDDELPGSALCRDTTMAIPLHNQMTDSDAARVVDAIKSASR